MRRNKKFDITKESLSDKSPKPLTPNSNAHTEKNPNILYVNSMVN